MPARPRQAVILAGGEGTRLRPLTNTRPKPLLPVLGRPCIEYTIRSLAEAGIEEIFLACGYRSDDVVRTLGDGHGYGTSIVYAYEEQPMGTAGAVKLLEDRLEERFVVGSGDTLTDADLGALIDFHIGKGAMATMGLTEVERPEQFGIVGVDADGMIERFKEKPRAEEVFSNVINAGTYVLDRRVLSLIPEATKFDFSKNLFPIMLARGMGLYAETLKGYWRDIGRPSDLLMANLEMAARRGDGGIEGAYPGVRLEQPLFFGKGNSIGAGCEIARSVLGRECSIGEGSRVTGSLLLDSVRIGRTTEIEDCVLGEGCVIGSGVSLKGTVLGDGSVVEGPASLD